MPSFLITDWSKSDRDQHEMHLTWPPDRRMSRIYFHNVSLPGGFFATEGMYHAELWKLAAAMGQTAVVIGENSFAEVIRFNFSTKACVPRPFLLVVGSGTVIPHSYWGIQGQHVMYNVHCEDCILTNCVPVTLPTRGTGPIMVFLVMQPPSVLLPIDVEGPWYANYGYQLALELQAQVRRTKRFLGLLIAGISAMVALVATATISSVALSQSVHTAKHVNSLAQNVSYALATQDHIDQKILSHLDGLEAVEFLGSQLSILRTQMSLMCHGGFQHICVTSLQAQNYSWDTVKHHLQGVW